MKCKICRSEKLKILNSGEKYYFCPECFLIFMDEKGFLTPSEERARYELHDNTPDNEGYVNMFLEFIEQVIDPIEENVQTALDFGCGPGPVLGNMLAEMGMEVDIYDLHFYPDRIFENKKYDLITCTEVLEHLKNPSSVIGNMVRRLQKRGYLAVMTSFHPGREEFADWWYRREETHISFYNSITMEKIADIFSLDLVYTDDEKYCLFKKTGNFNRTAGLCEIEIYP